MSMSSQNIYLSKSNRACPDHVMLVRQHLDYLGYRVIEHHGGEYDMNLLFECKIMVMVGIVPPTHFNDGNVLIGKGQYGQLRDRMNSGGSPHMRNIYFSHTEGDNNLVPIYRHVVVDGVHDTENWTTSYGKLKVNMGSVTKLNRIEHKTIVRKRHKAEIDGGQDMMKQADIEVDLSDPRTRAKHLACITLFK